MTDRNLFAPLRTDAELDAAFTPARYKETAVRDFVDTIAVKPKPEPSYRPLSWDRYSPTGDASRVVSPAIDGGLHDLQHADDWTPEQSARLAPLKRQRVIPDGGMVMLAKLLTAVGIVGAIVLVVMAATGWRP